MVSVFSTIRDRWEGIVEYFKFRVLDAEAVALNGIIQTAKRKSHGFRAGEYFSTLIYLVASFRDSDLPDSVVGAHRNSY